MSEAGKKQNRSAGFYEAQGKMRHMIIVTSAHKDKLKNLAKTYHVTQGEIVEVLIDNAELVPTENFENKRGERGDTKLTKTALLKQMKDLSPEQIAAIQAIVMQTKT